MIALASVGQEFVEMALWVAAFAGTVALMAVGVGAVVYWVCK